MLIRSALLAITSAIGVVLLGTAPLPAPLTETAAAQPDPLRSLTPHKPGPTGLSKGEFTVAIEGAKQGRFKGEGLGDGVKDKIIGLAFDYEIKPPLDSATGTHHHQPITFTKEWGAASPQLFQAAATGESLKSVVFEFYPVTPGGAIESFYTIRLSSAAITLIHQRMIEGRYMEEVSLSFAKIEVEHKAGKTAASDDAGK